MIRDLLQAPVWDYIYHNEGSRARKTDLEAYERILNRMVDSGYDFEAFGENALTKALECIIPIDYLASFFDRGSVTRVAHLKVALTKQKLDLGWPDLGTDESRREDQNRSG